MRVGRTSAWRRAAAVGLLAGAAGCAEQLTMPGRCPDFCTGDTLALVDTTLTGVVLADTSILPFNDVQDLVFLLAGDQDSLRSLAYIRFQPVPQSWHPDAGTDSVFVGTIDSVALQLHVSGRDTAATGLRILAYRAPVTLDSTTAVFDSLAAYAVPGQLVDSMAVDDTLAAGTVRQLLPVAALTPVDSDSFRIALVLDARGSIPTTVTLASNATALAATLTYYVRDSSGTDSTAIQVVPEFDTFARDPERAAGAAPGIRIGGQPASRAVVHFDLPSYIGDSVSVLRATLELRLRGAAQGRPGEGFLIDAAPVLRYFGGKSIVFSDTTSHGVALVTAGDTGTVEIEMAPVLRLWRLVPADTLPRVVVMRNRDETLSVGWIDAFGSGSGADAPRLRVTFYRPFSFRVP